MTEFLCAIGLLTLAAVVLIAIYITIEELIEKIKAFKWKYKRVPPYQIKFILDEDLMKKEKVGLNKHK